MVLILSAVLIASTGCSYAVDAVEGAITKRASFSVSVTHTGTNCTIDWSNLSSVDEDSFAGFEIYVTDEANDEFAGYTVLAAPYDLGDSAQELVSESLYESSTRSATVSFPSGTAGKVYYFRVGVVTWNVSTEEDRSKQWSGWSRSYGSLNKTFYFNSTSLGKISGGAKVVF